jgi:hypothetical protein
MRIVRGVPYGTKSSNHWYLSIVNPAGKLHGAVIVGGETEFHAVGIAVKTGLIPFEDTCSDHDWEVATVPMSEEDIEKVPAEYQGVLLTREQANKLDDFLEGK